MSTTAVSKQLQLASVAFNAPVSLQRGQTAEIELIVSRDVSAAKLQKQVTEAGTVEAHSGIKVSNRMAATLTGLGFAIDPETDKVQRLDVLPTTTWRWQVEPTRTGKLTLHLNLSALITADGAADTVTVRTFTKNMKVDVTWGYRVSSFFGGNWKWLFTTILIPLVLWLVRSRRRQAKPA